MKSNNLKTKILATILLIVTLFAYMPINAIVYAAETVAVEKIDISKWEITLDKDTAEYTGEAITPKVTKVSDGKTILEPAANEDIDYKVSYTNNINATTDTSKAKVTVTAKGNTYTGTITKEFTITAKALASDSVTAKDVVYASGAKVTTSVTVKDGTKTLAQGTDYTVAYSNNTNKGEATVTVTGKGNYTGTATDTFNIIAKSLTHSSVKVDAIADQTVGAIDLSKVVVKDGAKKLVKDTDYTIASTDTAIGKATATITGKGNYKDEIKANFNIVAKSLANKSVTVEKINDQTFTGKAIEVVPVVKDGETTLVKDTDYTVKYTNNTNVGTATITIEGKGNYAGTTKTATFKIVETDMTGVKVTVPTNVAYIYTGSEIKPTVKVEVTVDGKQVELKEGTDYTVTAYEDNINVGTAKITISGKGNYKGKAEVNFTIAAKQISDCSVDKIADQPYTVGGVIPEVVVKDGAKKLVKDTDYTLAASNNVNLGTNTATVTITGKGNYAGTKTYNFSIVARDLKDCTIADIDNEIYTGSQVTPSVVIMNGESPLELDTDYTVEYKNNIEIGKATVTITAKGNYKGTATKTFGIATGMDGFSITNTVEDQVFTGKEITPNVVVSNGKITLVKDKDYKVVYENNINVATKTDAKAPTITVKGAGNYAGTLTPVKFNITQKDLKDCTIEEIPSQVLKEGSACTPGVTVKNGTVVLKEGTDYTLEYKNNTTIGEAVVIVKVKAGGNYKGDDRKVNFNIGKSIASAKINAIADQKYTGKAITPVVVVKDGDKTLVKDTDYTVAYTNNINAGKATVTVTGKGAYAGKITATFTIIKEATKPVHTHSYKTTITKATMSKNGSIVKKCSCGATTKTTIAKISSVKLSGTTYTYNGKTKYPQVTVKDAKGKKIASKYYTVKHSSSTRKNVGAYTVKVTFKGNYSGSKTLNFTIRPKAVKVSSVKAGSKRVTVKWNKQTAQTTGYQVQYATNSKFSKAKTVKVTSNKTTSKTVTKLSAKKKYSVRVRTYKTVNGKTYYSAWSNVKTATTRK